MQLVKLTVQNWKCWNGKKVWDFDQHELFMAANGTGKTSLFEAVQFAITGKPPAGFNLNTVRNDEKSSAMVDLRMVMSGQQVEIKRIFGVKPEVQLAVDGSVVAESIGDVNKWFGAAIPLDMISMFWSGDLVHSNVLNAADFTDLVLEESLKDAKSVLAALTKEKFAVNRSMKEIEIGEIIDLDQINLEIERFQQKITDTAVAPDGQLLLAQQAKAATEHLAGLDEKIILQQIAGVDLIKYAEVAGKTEQLQSELNSLERLESDELKKAALAQQSAAELKLLPVSETLESIASVDMAKYAEVAGKTEQLKLELVNLLNLDMTGMLAAAEADKKLKTMDVDGLMRLAGSVDLDLYESLLPKRSQMIKKLESCRKKVNKSLHGVDVLNLQAVSKASVELGSCLLCGEKYGKNEHERLMISLKNDAKLAEEIKDLESKLGILESMDSKQFKSIQAMMQLKNLISACPNYAELMMQRDQRMEILKSKIKLSMSCTPELLALAGKIIKLQKNVESCQNWSEVLNSRNGKIEELKLKIELSLSCTPQALANYHKLINLKEAVDKCPNWSEVLKQSSDAVEELWKIMKILQEQKSAALAQKEKIKKLEALTLSLQTLNERQVAVKGWIAEARENYTRMLLALASKHLARINSRYQGIYINDKEFLVTVQDEEGVLSILPVARLSGGERTVVALSLVVALHEMFAPPLPLLFDETFSALDQENLYHVKRFLSAQRNVQILVITHDQSWEGWI